jgi:hypothetical protein
LRCVRCVIIWSYGNRNVLGAAMWISRGMQSYKHTGVLYSRLLVFSCDFAECIFEKLWTFLLLWMNHLSCRSLGKAVSLPC